MSRLRRFGLLTLGLFLVGVVAAAISGAVNYQLGYESGKHSLPQPSIKVLGSFNWGRYIPAHRGYATTVTLELHNVNLGYQLAYDSANANLIQSDRRNLMYPELTIYAAPAAKVTMQIQITTSAGTAKYDWNGGTTPDKPANDTPPKGSVTVERLDDPLVSPNCLFRITPILGPGENPSHIEALEGYSGFDWGVPVNIFRLHVADPQMADSFDLSLYDRTDLRRPTGSIRQPLSC